MKMVDKSERKRLGNWGQGMCENDRKVNSRRYERPKIVQC